MNCERLNLLQFCKLCEDSHQVRVGLKALNKGKRTVFATIARCEIGGIFAEFTCEQQARGRCTHKPISYNGRCSAIQDPGQTTQDGFLLAHKRAQVGYGAKKKKTLPQCQYNDCIIGAIPALWTPYCRLATFVALVSFSGTGHTGAFNKFLGA